MHLELHVMRTITSLEGESLVQVLLQHGNLLDALHQLSIHSLLVGLALLRNDGLHDCIHQQQRTTYSLEKSSSDFLAGALK